jgi:hypothetical protein
LEAELAHGVAAQAAGKKRKRQQGGGAGGGVKGEDGGEGLVDGLEDEEGKEGKESLLADEDDDSKGAALLRWLGMGPPDVGFCKTKRHPAWARQLCPRPRGCV